MIGQQIAQFRVLEKIGEGGMGVVYKALDTRLNRPVALKVLPPGNANLDVRARFFQEARAASALNHPNIVTIYDILTHQGQDIIVMEFIAGKTLDALIPRKGMRLGEVMRVGIAVADALATAHTAGITHRDLKPANVMVGESGVVKLLDFGLAKTHAATSISSEDPTLRTPATKDGVIAGTLHYMSPEQAQGRPDLDGRSDVFSFGAMLHEMITGALAFAGDSGVSTLAAILRDEPVPVRELAPDTPRELERIVRRCLNKDPKRRFQHIGDAALSLMEVKEDLDSGLLRLPAGEMTRRGRQWPLMAAAGVVLALLGVEAWRHTRMVSGEERIAATQLTAYPGDERHPSLSPDGNQVAFSWNGERQDNDDVYIKIVGSSAVPLRLTTNQAADVWPSWSPNGQMVAFLRAMEPQRYAVMAVSPLGGGERKLGDVTIKLNYESRPVWTPDSKWLMVSDRSPGETSQSLFLMSVESGERRRLTKPGPLDGDDFGASLRPDGSEMAFVRGNVSIGTRLFTLALDGEFRAKGEASEQLASISMRNTAWSRDGGSIFYAAGMVLPRGMFQYSRAGGLQVLAPTELQDVTQGIAIGDGVMVYSVRRRDNNIWRVSLRDGVAGDDPDQFLSSTVSDDWPRYSDDGARIVFRSLRSGSHQVWSSDADGRNPVQLSNHAKGLASQPVVSPDGKAVAFWAIREDRGEICMTTAEGGPTTCSIEDKHLLSGPMFSADGAHIFFASGRTGQSQIWKSRPDGSGSEQLTRNGGGWMLTATKEDLYYDREYSLWRYNFSTGKEELVLRDVDVRNAAWTKNGLYFTPPPGRAPVIRHYAFGSGTTRDLMVLDHPLVSGMSVSPNGKHLLFTQMESYGSDLMLMRKNP